MAELRRPRRARRVRLDQPLEQRATLPRPFYDPDAFGKLSERIARFLGTARFLVYLTLFVAVWLAWNALSPESLQFDPRSKNFTLLTLILSLQASYAAPLILLAQNRQADRDRVAQEEDRAQNQRLQSDVEYLSRELASLRLSLGEVATRDFLRDQLRDLAEEVVARTTDSAFDERGRLEREDRDRRAEQRRKRAETSDPDTGTLSQPFVGGTDAG
ncbi:MAG TPA: DUF1003 domain-containing protein [Mycobacteriales bacterium]|nr:DUF1003 domain-containing protein [Mycobacteriales bacterium]